jgi:S1-C subfamily serine protease
LVALVAFLASCTPAQNAAARVVPGDSPLARWLDGILVPAEASVVQVIAYRPSGLVSASQGSSASVFRLEPARCTYWATGVVVGADGLVLACAEAAQPGDSLEIRLPGGLRTGARFLAQDLNLGLSLIRAEDATGLVPVPLALVGVMHRGEAVVILGHRAGKDGPEFRFARISDSRGGPEGPRYYRLALGDCHGACGDAVFDEHGAFRGIVVGVRAERERDLAPPLDMPEGDPFECEWVSALSASGVSETARALVVASRDPVGFLGVTAAASDSGAGGPDRRTAAGDPLQVTRVLPGSPADAAGLQPGDQIVALDGRPVSSMEQIADLIASTLPGREIRIRVLRGGASLALTARLADRSALGWMDQQARLDAIRKKRLQSAIDRLQREIRELDAHRRSGP